MRDHHQRRVRFQRAIIAATLCTAVVIEGGNFIERSAIAAAAESASLQALTNEFAYGRDYTFERMEATRAVNDTEDNSTIRLVTYVYRPVKNDRREVVLYSHGSTGGLSSSPREPSNFPQRPVIRFFVSRGYTLVAPLRRGRGDSTGTYIEECSVYVGQCTTADQVALTERGLREALLDTNAVIDQLVLGRLVPSVSKIIVAGHSRGGFLSLMLAAERPAVAKGVINFAGGWLATTRNLSDAENQQRTEEQTARVARAAKRVTVPTIWIYAVRDSLYQDRFPLALVTSWRNAGAHAEFVHVTEHSLPDGHTVPTDAALWGRQMDAFLRLIQG